MSTEHGAFYKNAAWQYGLQFVKYLFPFITMPYLTRVLEPEGYAVYAYVASFMLFVQTFVDFGFNLSGTKSIASARTVEEENCAIGAVTQARILLCLVAGAVVFVVALCIPITASNLGYTLIAFVAVCGKAMAPDFVFQGHENMAPITTRFFISKGVSTALTFVCVHSVADIIWVPVLDILSSAIALVWSFVAAKRMFGTTIAWVPMRTVLRELRTSALYCFSNMAATAFSGFTTLLIGVVISDTAQISYWSLAITAVGAIQSLYSPVINALYPHMVKSGDFAFAKKLALVALPALLAGTVAFALLSNVVMLVLGGEDYLAGSWVVAALSPLLFFGFYAMLFGWPVLGAAGKVKEVAVTTAVSSFLCIVSLLVMSFAGLVSMLAICIIRDATEFVFCATRVWCFYRLVGERRIDRQDCARS